MIRKGIIITNLFAIICCIKFILIDLTTFDLSYTVYNRERDIQTNTYILYCKNDLGKFKIDVNEKTYNNKPYGSIVRYDKPFSSYEMYMFATDRETEQNVLNSDATVYFASDPNSAGRIATAAFFAPLTEISPFICFPPCITSLSKLNYPKSNFSGFSVKNSKQKN